MTAQPIFLRFCGYDVQKEYYINDSGRQIQTLGLSVYLRGREQLGHSVEFPDTCYQGDYIRDLAGELIERDGKELFEKDESEALMVSRPVCGGKNHRRHAGRSGGFRDHL